MRELLYQAADEYQNACELTEQQNLNEAMLSFARALRNLHGVRPQRKRDILLAHLHLSRYQAGMQRPAEDIRWKNQDKDLRLGYSYARSTKEPHLRALAEEIWQEHLRRKAAL